MEGCLLAWAARNRGLVLFALSVFIAFFVGRNSFGNRQTAQPARVTLDWTSHKTTNGVALLQATKAELASIAQHFNTRREVILAAWEAAVKADLSLAVGASLNRVEFLDHVPALLDTFERDLLEFNPEDTRDKVSDFPKSAASDGLKRWQQGYDLGELVRELGRLNECVVDEIDGYTQADHAISHHSVGTARRIWARFTTVGIEESVRQYAPLQREEAIGQAKDLEAALAELRHAEAQRNDLWQQAAHDLRGNLGVVANASIGLTHTELAPSARDRFVRILMRNVTSLHQLLDDVTQLARLQAGRENRRLQNIDVTPLLQSLCEGIRPVADQKQLYLRCEGPAGLGVQSDAVKVRRIAQNLILNAVKFTQTGGITVDWSDGVGGDAGRWVLSIADTGPGFASESGRPIASALEKDGLPVTEKAATEAASTLEHPKVIDSGAGEGLGLSIVKRLCEILDATIERRSIPDRGTTFTISFPKSYLVE
jgi:signal transduction histidine kinase